MQGIKRLQASTSLTGLKYMLKEKDIHTTITLAGNIKEKS